MKRACRPSPAWLRWAVLACAVVLLAPGPAESQCDGPEFGTSPPPPALAGDVAYELVVGDFYGPGGILDGKPDVVVTTDTDRARVFTGDGTGKLTFLLDVTVGDAPRELVTADFDNDGFDDLALIPTGEGGVVRFFPGDGSGAFLSPVDLNVSNPSRLATADFNRDGLLDLVVVREADVAISVFRGVGGFGFGLFPSQPTIPGTQVPVAPVTGDFDRDGKPDLAVAMNDSPVGQVSVYLGDGMGLLGGAVVPPTDPFFTVSVGVGPLDIAARDATGNGTIDLVTADHDSASATFLEGQGDGSFAVVQTVLTALTEPRRVALEDFDRDGLVDLAVMNETGFAPTLAVFPGSLVLPVFDEANIALVPLVQPLDMAIGDVDVDGRVDAVIADWNPGALEGEAKWIPNAASLDCLRTSFYRAPRAYGGGNGPVWVAIGDYNEDGHDDMVAANYVGGDIQLHTGTGNGFTPQTPVPVGIQPRGIAGDDMNVDGHADVVVAWGNSVDVFLGDGTGALNPSDSELLAAGAMTSAVVTGDFNGDGAPDVAATAQATSQVFVFLGDGFGGLDPAPNSPFSAGGVGPRALAVGLVGPGLELDLVVANSLSDEIAIFQGVGDGSFSANGTAPMGDAPWGVALADFDGDGNLDVATADHDSSTMSVRPGNGGGGFGTRIFEPVSGVPIALGAFDVTDDMDADVMVVTGDHTLSLFRGFGDGSFDAETSHPVRTRPSAVAAVDADSDGLKDVVVPCRDADSIVVLLARPPDFEEPPSLLSGDSPFGVVNGDFDWDGDLDIAVANAGSDDIVVFENDGFGLFAPLGGDSTTASPQSLVVADFDRDGDLDLATALPGVGLIEVLLGGPGLSFATGVTYPAGSTPVDLAVGDFDQDGWPDIAVSNNLNPTGQVTFLSNDGDGTFTNQGSVNVGDGPASITVADFSRDGWLDVAVANDNSDDLTVLYNDGATWLFGVSETLPLDPGDTSPVSITSGDFDGDGDVDLAAAAVGSGMISVSENFGAFFPFFNTTPSRFNGSHNPLFLAAVDVNLDGTLDLVAAAEGMKVLPGIAGTSPDFLPSEDVVAGLKPRALTVGDFDGDGRPDTAVANETSGDLTLLYSTACQSRRLVMGVSPAACSVSGPPFAVNSTVRVEDDGGNLASCEAGAVTGGIAPGTGTGGALYSGPNPVSVTGGSAVFNSHQIDLPGDRYRLQFDLGGVPSVFSRSFTLGGAVGITGPPSICPGTFETYTADLGFDSYAWSLDGTPFEWQRVVSLSQPPLATGTSYTLSVDARVDGCLQTAAMSVYVGDLASVALGVTGGTVVCVDCLGGTVDSTPTGGGTPVGYQWGYRAVSGTPPIIDIPGQTGPQYVINGQDFPDVGTYFLVVKVTPTCGSVAVSDEVAVTVTAAVPSGEVKSLGATSRGPAGVGENILQWVNTNGAAEENLIRWNKASPDPSVCAPPSSELAPADGEQAIPSPGVSKQSWTHTPVDLDTAYCYSVFVKVSGSYSAGRTVKARAFDSSTGPVAWAYASGATAVVPPTVSSDAVFVLSNDRSIFALERGILGGTWAVSYTPQELLGVAHSRSPAVPFLVPVAGADTLFFVGDDNGDVTAVDTQTGVAAWGPQPLPSSMVTGAPGGFFLQYGGPADAILVGSRNVSAGPSLFYSLNLNTGAPISTFDGTATTLGLGQVLSTPTLDYSTGRVYVTSWRFMGTEPSVWCLQVLGDGSIDPTPVWIGLPAWGDMSASPVMANSRVYVANTAGEIYSVKADDGTPGPAYPTTDGAVKGFLFPNRATGELFFATATKVHSVSDTGGTLTSNWTWDAGATLEPSIVLHWPGTDLLYVGSKDGTLWEVDFSLAPTLSSKQVVLGDGKSHVGAPSLDIGLVPPDVSSPGKSLLLVGSEEGVLYAVEVPLP